MAAANSCLFAALLHPCCWNTHALYNTLTAESVRRGVVCGCGGGAHHERRPPRTASACAFVAAEAECPASCTKPRPPAHQPPLGLRAHCPLRLAGVCARLLGRPRVGLPPPRLALRLQRLHRRALWRVHGLARRARCLRRLAHPLPHRLLPKVEPQRACAHARAREVTVTGE